MSIDENIPYLRILNANQSKENDKLWVLAGTVRLFNVMRVWIYEAEVRLSRYENNKEDNKAFYSYLLDSSHHAIQLLRYSYFAVKADNPLPELASLEQELFKFETLYLSSNICLVIDEEKVNFEPERFEFLRHNLHGVLHDLSQPMSNLITLVGMTENVNLMDPVGFATDLHSILIQSKAQLQRGFELIKGSFALEELSSEQLEAIVAETLEMLLKHTGIEYQLKNQMAEGIVIYSSLWLRGLISNVVDNAKKSFVEKGKRLGHGDFERQLEIVIQPGHISDNRQCLALTVTDNGIGFHQDILTNGFVSGKSTWTDHNLVGQGVGMSTHEAFIKKIGGEVVLENLTNEREVLGAKLTANLPMI